MRPQTPVPGSEETLKIIGKGKTKVIYKLPDNPDHPPIVLVHNTDNITAQDGLRLRVVPEKGRVSSLITTLLFEYLAEQGIPNHLVAPKRGVALGNDYFRTVKRLVANTGLPDLHFHSSFFAQQLDMQPFEFVVRRIATGSFLKRHPRAVAGGRFEEPVVEVFYKNDADHDPLVMIDTTSANLVLFENGKPLDSGCPRVQPIDPDQRVKTYKTFSRGKEIALKVFLILEEFFARCNITLVDFKIEAGINQSGDIILGDVITPDEMRLWPDGDPKKARDKQKFRNAKDNELTPEMLASLLADYEYVLTALRTALGEPDMI